VVLLGCLGISAAAKPAQAAYICPAPPPAPPGQATASAAVWSYPNSPYTNPNNPNFVQTQTGLTPAAVLGPGIPGSNPNTFVQIAGISPPACLWVWQGAAFGGDSISYDGTDLLPFVTPTSGEARVSGQVMLTHLDATSVQVDVTWSGSDAGTAHRLMFFDISDLSSPVELVQHRMLRAGPHDESFSMVVSIPSGVSNLRVQFDALGVSAIPEPSALALLGLGGVGLCAFACYRRTA
jgi:hypothetical protein